MSGAWEVRFTRQARKDVERLSPKLKKKLRDILLNVIGEDPHVGKKLLGDLAGSTSYRLTIKDRIVYSLDQERKIVYVERARTHHGDSGIDPGWPSRGTPGGEAMPAYRVRRGRAPPPAGG